VGNSVKLIVVGRWTKWKMVKNCPIFDGDVATIARRENQKNWQGCKRGRGVLPVVKIESLVGGKLTHPDSLTKSSPGTAY